jgi:hypothetical protein
MWFQIPSPRGGGVENPLLWLTEVSIHLFLLYINLADINKAERAHTGLFHAAFVPLLRWGVETTKIAIAANHGVRC